MEELRTSESANSLASKLNANFGLGSSIQVVSENDNAQDFVDKINSNFENIEGGASGVFPAHTVLTTDIGDFKAGEDIGGVSIGDFVEFGINGAARSKFRFLHASDTHGTNSSIKMAKELMEDDEEISYFINSGDIFHDIISYMEHSNANLKMKSALESIGQQLLMVPGNHELRNVFLTAEGIKNGRTVDGVYYPGFAHFMENSGVTWGTADASYWYKDIANVDGLGNQLRIIGLDEYVSDSNTAYPKYTQAQVDWLCGLLKQMGSDDYLMIVVHQPPVRNITESYDYRWQSGETASPEKLFVSDKINNVGYNVWVNGSGGIAQYIVDAYLNKVNCVAQGGVRSKVGGTIIATANDVSLSSQSMDFSNCEPCNFLCYLTGHIHTDIATYLIDFPEQLNLNIDCSLSTKAMDSDLDRSGDNLVIVPSLSQTAKYWVCLNDVTFDFSTKRIVVRRIGGKITDGDGTLGESRIRDTVFFPFRKGGAS